MWQCAGNVYVREIDVSLTCLYRRRLHSVLVVNCEDLTAVEAFICHLTFIVLHGSASARIKLCQERAGGKL